MKNSVVVLDQLKKLSIKDTHMPIPKDNEVLIKVKHVGICGSDIHIFEHGPIIPPKDPNTVIGIGHECAGKIIGLGKDVSGFAVGDRVAIEAGIPCGQCKFCSSGHYNICPSINFMATQPTYRGAMTEYLAHPAQFVFKLPGSVTTQEGALIEPLAVGFNAAIKGGVTFGSKIVVLGAGAIGLMVVQACKAMGASEIVVTDIIDKRMEIAKKIGATAAINALTEDVVTKTKDLLGPHEADVVFETAGTIRTAQQALSIVRFGGTVVIVGMVKGDTPINFMSVSREVVIRTVYRYSNLYPSLIDAVAKRKVDLNALVTQTFPYERVQEAFECSVNNKNETIKIMIEIPD
jgi:L-iditol 2-dehydrogenase